MEVLSGVASGMAVASLSLQLIESIGKIQTFIKSIRGASKELDRLEFLLNRLEVLLQDVRDVVGRQASLQSQHFPAPSMTMISCVKACEDSLAALQRLINKFATRKKSSASILAQMKNDMKFGLMIKDVTSFELRIQRDIDLLHTALSVNSTAIL